MFSKDIQHYRYRTARTLTEAFGPGSKLHVERRSSAKEWAWAVGCGVAIGCVWWICVALRAGAA
jgi:ferric-dicitrate binding protein FerR (iron transport regulator)